MDGRKDGRIGGTRTRVHELARVFRFAGAVYEDASGGEGGDAEKHAQPKRPTKSLAREQKLPSSLRTALRKDGQEGVEG